MKRKKKELFNFELGQVLPSAIDLEEELLGCLITWSNLLNEVIHIMPSGDRFYKESHQIIYNILTKMFLKGIPADMILLINELKKVEKLEVVGGAYYITLLCAKAIQPYQIIRKTLIITEMWMKRESIRISSETIRKAYQDSYDVFNIIDLNLNEFTKLIPEIQEGKTTAKNAFIHTVNDLMLHINKEIKTFFPIGQKVFDETCGISPGFWIVAAASGIGKTSWITSIIFDLLKAHYKDVSIQWVAIDHENRKSIVKKFISRKLKVTTNLLEGRGKNTFNRMNELPMLEGEFNKYDIEFIDKTDTIQHLGIAFKKFCKQKERKKKLKVFLLDNMMSLKGYTEVNEFQLQIITSISEMKNELESQDHNVLFIILHHLTKEALKNNAHIGYRPTKETIRGNAIFEAKADKIFLLNRPGKYDDISKPYPDLKFIEKMFMVDLVKNTFGEEKLMKFWSSHAYTIFEEINELNK